MNLTVCFAAALSTGLKLTHFQPRAVVVALHVKQYTTCTNMSKWRARAGEGGGPSHGALIYTSIVYYMHELWLGASVAKINPSMAQSSFSTHTPCCSLRWICLYGEPGPARVVGRPMGLSLFIYICLHIWACAEKKSERGVGSLAGAGAAPISFYARPPCCSAESETHYSGITSPFS